MISKEEFSKRFTELSQELAAITMLHVQDPESTQILYEALAYEIGFIDALCCLGGVQREDRIKSKDKFFKAGKQHALNGHVALCPLKPCKKSEELDLEINGN